MKKLRQDKSDDENDIAAFAGKNNFNEIMDLADDRDCCDQKVGDNDAGSGTGK